MDGVATSLVVYDEEGLMTRYGRRFHKLTGSGNDFVFIDGINEPLDGLDTPDRMAEICAAGTGVGSDGIVFVEPGADGALFSIRYYNRDGSLALLCGNASLCSVRYAVELGLAKEGEAFEFATGAGRVRGRLGATGPEIELQPPADIDPSFATGLGSGETRIGFLMVGVPHLVVRCDSLEELDLVSRGRRLRHDPGLAAGANVNFVARTDGGWGYRTYERGVEAETLACGTGAVAAATMLALWGESEDDTTLATRSGRPVRVRLRREPISGSIFPSLNGEGRIVFRGELAL